MADQTTEFDGNPSPSVSACFMCGHRAVWHHDERGCQYHGNGPDRCACRRTSDQVIARLIYEAMLAGALPYLNASVTDFPEKPATRPGEAGGRGA